MNEDEEQAHCLNAAREFWREYDDSRNISNNGRSSASLTQHLIRERAAARAEQAQVPCVQHFDAIETLKAKLAWFYEREPLVRALAGAAEDSNAAQGEWRALVYWEMDHPRGKS